MNDNDERVTNWMCNWERVMKEQIEKGIAKGGPIEITGRGYGELLATSAYFDEVRRADPSPDVGEVIDKSFEVKDSFPSFSELLARKRKANG